MSTPQIKLDWFDALLILRRVLDQPRDIRELIERVELDWSDGASIKLIQSEGDKGTDMITLWMNPVLRDAPKIERVEGLLYGAAGVWFNIHYPGDVFFGAPREAFRFLCQRAGCWWGNSSSIRERWRMIDYKTPVHLLPLATFEDRYICKVCSQPVASGAGCNVYASGKPVLESDTLDPMFNLLSLKYRPDLHEECGRYVHRILIPARLDQIAEEKRRTSAEVDR